MGVGSGIVAQPLVNNTWRVTLKECDLTTGSPHPRGEGKHKYFLGFLLVPSTVGIILVVAEMWVKSDKKKHVRTVLLANDKMLCKSGA